MTLQRRLTAILAADVVGYSALMGADEARTLAALVEMRNKLFEPTVAARGGNIIKRMGDGWIIEYPNVSDAVECAIEIQQGLSDHDIIQLRIGVHIGDVTFQDDDVYGDGINVAARLETSAEPGQVLISDTAHNSLDGKAAEKFAGGEQHELKNIARPVAVWRWPAANDETASAPTELSLPDKPSIAVLPFENMSNDPDQEFFADGMSEDIITALSRSPWLFIIARNTTFTYKGGNVDVKRVASELGVRYVLEGSVRKAGNRIRLTAQLIDGTTGGHVWSERYDGELADIFDLQDEITRNVVASIQTQVFLTASEPVRKSKRPNLTVWELIMRGWQLLYDFSPESYTTAKSLLEEAIQHDPNSAEAHLVLALIHYHDALMGFTNDEQASLNAAHQLALRATRLDNQNEYACWALGLSYWGLSKHTESIASLERALELNPNCSVAYGSLGTVLSLVGRVDEAIANQEIAMRSNPRDPSIFFRFTGIALPHYLAGRYDEAIEWAAKAIHRMPTWYFGHYLLATSHMQADREAEAKAAIDRCLEQLPDATISLLDRMPITDAAVMAQLRDNLRKAGLPG
jgi:TolB-like protein/Flp pilus assembly protein TadD